MKKKNIFNVVLSMTIAIFAFTLNSCNKESKEVKVKNIIMLIGDGMGPTHIPSLMLEEQYAPTNFERAKRAAFVTTYSSNNRVTDSAAAYFGEGEVYYMMQDWGSYIGMFTIDSLAKDDVDGESDWFIYRISMERSGLYELKSVSAAISDVGVDFEYVGDAVGMYSGKGVDELINAVNKAQALWESNDDAACKTAADE